MKNAVIIHGWGGNSQSNWFPWLKTELEKQEFRVSVPDFPNTEYPILSEWLDHCKSNITVDEETILIGHSLGVSFILRFLEQLDSQIKAAFLVAGFERSLNIPEVENFVHEPFDWQKIKKACRKFFVINSDNDPYIPLSIAHELAKKLDAKLFIEHNEGHLNGFGGTPPYNKLLNLIFSTE